MSEDMFEEVTATKYKPDITERTKEEARPGRLVLAISFSGTYVVL